MKRIAYTLVALAMIAGPAMAADDDAEDCTTVKQFIRAAAAKESEEQPPTLVKLNHDQGLVALGMVHLGAALKGKAPNKVDSIAEVVMSDASGVLFGLKGKCITTLMPISSMLVASLKTLGKTADDEE